MCNANNPFCPSCYHKNTSVEVEILKALRYWVDSKFGLERKEIEKAIAEDMKLGISPIDPLLWKDAQEQLSPILNDLKSRGYVECIPGTIQWHLTQKGIETVLTSNH